MNLYVKPQHIRSDHGAELTAVAVMRWLRDQSVGPVFIAPGHPRRRAPDRTMAPLRQPPPAPRALGYQTPE